ncbi:ectoine/hydroxyectoine ABC transporter substrate-binding protein EhuB [Deferribacteres bacterium DY0037]
MIFRKLSKTAFVAVLTAAIFVSAFSADAGSLNDRIKKGDSIRIGFANEIPWAYPGENNKPLGFVNAYILGVLETMGYTNIEPVVTEWGGLIPGLKANRFDIITGGMYILNSRCQNIAFSEPMGQVTDAFIVKKGNPEGIKDYKDIVKKGAVLATGAGYNTIEAAKKEGVPSDKIMVVPGPTEILAAVKAGRAAAGGMTYFTALNLAKESNDVVEVTDPAALPDWTLNYVGIGFRKTDKDFLKKFNEAQKKYLGTPEMMESVKEYGYTKSQLPGNVKTEWVCNNR